jgi:hypothetical protein
MILFGLVMSLKGPSYRLGSLSTIVTVFGVALFSYVLQIPMPVLTWRGL